MLLCARFWYALCCQNVYCKAVITVRHCLLCIICMAASPKYIVISIDLQSVYWYVMLPKCDGVCGKTLTLQFFLAWMCLTAMEKR